jgi:hypothetical protein
MSALKNTLKSLACALAAAVITVSMSYGMVTSSAALPIGFSGNDTGSHIALAHVLIQPSHPWFGQPSPAVLVD